MLMLALVSALIGLSAIAGFCIFAMKETSFKKSYIERKLDKLRDKRNKLNEKINELSALI